MMLSSCRTRSGGRLADVFLLMLVVSLWISSERAHAQTAPVLVDLGTLGGRFRYCYRGERVGAHRRRERHSRRRTARICVDARRRHG